MIASRTNIKLGYILVFLICFVIIAIFYENQLTKLGDKLLQLGKKFFSFSCSILKYQLSEIAHDKLQASQSEQNKNLDDNLIILYNRVPKTGSTSFVGIAYDLCKKNEFYVLHVNITANSHILTLDNQIKFIYNVTNWTNMKPALYHGHFAFLDFSK